MQKNLHEYASQPFEWGTHDCALFAAKHIEAITGEDLGKDFAGKYSTPLGSLKALKEAGYDNLLQLCQDKFPEVHISTVRTGDLVVLNSADTGYALAVVLGETLGVLTLNGYGIIRKTDKNVVTGFKIG